MLRIMEPIGKQLGGGLYQAGYSVVGESNPIAAMPSIHFAVTFLLCLGGLDYGRDWRIAADRCMHFRWAWRSSTWASTM